MTSHDEPKVGRLLNRLRKEQGFSLRALADRCGLSTNAISQIERGESSPTVSSLHALAKALGVSVVDLFSTPHEEAVVYVQAQNRLRTEAAGIVMESLGTGLRNQELEPFLMTIRVGEEGGGQIRHSGQEFVFCLTGSVDYLVGDAAYRLHEGDSLLFEANLPHSLHNVGVVDATILVIFQAESQAHLAAAARKPSIIIPQPEEPPLS